MVALAGGCVCNLRAKSWGVQDGPLLCLIFRAGRHEIDTMCLFCYVCACFVTCVPPSLETDGCLSALAVAFVISLDSRGVTLGNGAG